MESQTSSAWSELLRFARYQELGYWMVDLRLQVIARPVCLRPPHDLSILHHEIDLPHCFDVIQRIYRRGDNVGRKTRHNCSALLVDPKQLRVVRGHAFKHFRCWHACGPPDCQVVPSHVCTRFVWQINYNV